jgi:hypothetical protein
MANLQQTHLHATMHILCYIRHTLTMGFYLEQVEAMNFAIIKMCTGDLTQRLVNQLELNP